MKGKWSGPPRNHLEAKFNLWAWNLLQCVEIDTSSKQIEHIELQRLGGYQNSYISTIRHLD